MAGDRGPVSRDPGRRPRRVGRRSPIPATPAGTVLRTHRQEIGIPIATLAATRGVPYQRLRHLEIGTRGDTELGLGRVPFHPGGRPV